MHDGHMRELAQAADDQRVALYGAALRHYDGHPPQALKFKPGEPDDNVSTNYAAIIVDKGVSFLFGEAPRLAIKPKGSGPKNTDQKGEELLEEVWPEDQRAEDLIDLATNGGVFGDVWATIILEDGEPRVSVVDPLNMSAEWDPHNFRRVLKYRCQYETFTAAGDPLTCRQDTERGEGGTWWIRNYEAVGNASTFTQVGEPVHWRMSRAPVYHVKNLPKANEFYGRPDLTRYVLALVHYINRADSLINRILRIHSHPKPVARGLKKQDLQLGTMDILFLPEKEQDLKLLEMTGNLEGALRFRKQLRENLAEVSHVPEVATSKTENVGQLSGRAMRILYGPLLDRTKIKRRLYGRFLKDLVAGLLEVKGLEGQEVSITWPEALPQDEKESAETAGLLHQVGVSRETLLERLGFDPVEEARRRQDEGGSLAETLMKAFEGGHTDGGNLEAADVRGAAPGGTGGSGSPGEIPNAYRPGLTPSVDSVD
jgi:hypothetical protein